MSNEQKRNLGLLILRAGIGAMFILAHGMPKLMGGPERWALVGGAMSTIGISFAPTFWGFLATMTEVGGGLLLIVGLFTRFAGAALAFTMFVAMTMHMANGDSFAAMSHPIEIGIVSIALVVAGAGAYSLDAKVRRKA